MILVSKLEEVWVFADKEAAFAELCSGAHLLGQKVKAIVAGNRDKAEHVLKMGADLVYYLGDKAAMLEDYTATILAIIKHERPELLLVQNCVRIKLIAGRLAACLGTSVLTNVFELIEENGTILGKRMILGGLALQCERINYSLTIAAIGTGVFKHAKIKPTGAGTIIDVNYINEDTGLKLIAKKKKKTQFTNLGSAKRVVGVGRGFKKAEDLQIAVEIADLLEAEVSCSRPIAEGFNWLAKERIIGVSGSIIKPDLYLAVGISGQIQHMAGVNQAKKILAINKDKNAPIFKESDYGIIGDLYIVLPALIKLIKNNNDEIPD